MEMDHRYNISKPPTVCFYCNKPNHKAADCFYKFKDERKQMKCALTSMGGNGGVSQRLSSFTKPIRPLHQSPRMGIKHYTQISTNSSSYQNIPQNFQRIPRRNIPCDFSRKLSPELRRDIHQDHIPQDIHQDIHQDIQDHDSFDSPTPRQTFEQNHCKDSSECRSVFSEVQENDNFTNSSRGGPVGRGGPAHQGYQGQGGQAAHQGYQGHQIHVGGHSSMHKGMQSQLPCQPLQGFQGQSESRTSFISSEEDDFVNALQYMTQERKRLGKELFWDMPCSTEIGEKIHKALVECEKNFN